MQIIANKSEFSHKEKVHIGLNASACNFYKSGKYDLEYKNEGGTDSLEWISGEKLAENYSSLVDKNNIRAIEDAFDFDDLLNSACLTRITGLDK
jgi:enolase